jgi:site-specific recombinase XerC
MEQGCLQSNPLNDIEKPKIEQKLPKRFSKQESLRLLEIVYNYPYSSAFLRYRNHALFAMFIYPGLRLNECMHLKYADVDLDNKSIFICLGKGGKGSHGSYIINAMYDTTEIFNRKKKTQQNMSGILCVIPFKSRLPLKTV